MDDKYAREAASSRRDEKRNTVLSFVYLIGAAVMSVVAVFLLADGEGMGWFYAALAVIWGALSFWMRSIAARNRDTAQRWDRLQEMYRR